MVGEFRGQGFEGAEDGWVGFDDEIVEEDADAEGFGCAGLERC